MLNEWIALGNYISPEVEPLYNMAGFVSFLGHVIIDSSNVINGPDKTLRVHPWLYLKRKRVCMGIKHADTYCYGYHLAKVRQLLLT